MTAPKKTIGVKSLWLMKQWRVASFSAMDICLTELHRQHQAVMCCQHSGLSKWNQTPAKKSGVERVGIKTGNRVKTGIKFPA